MTFARRALSVAVGESSSDHAGCFVPLAELAQFASSARFEAIGIRPSVLSVHDDIRSGQRVREMLSRHGLGVSMVTGDEYIASNDVRAPQALEKITPHLDLAKRVGAPLVEISIHSWRSIPALRAAADKAGDRGLVLAHHIRCDTLLHSMEETLEVIEQVDRPESFGVIYDTAEVARCGMHPTDAAARLLPHLVNVQLSTRPGQHRNFVPRHAQDPEPTRARTGNGHDGALAALLRLLNDGGYSGPITWNGICDTSVSSIKAALAEAGRLLSDGTSVRNEDSKALDGAVKGDNRELRSDSGPLPDTRCATAVTTR